MAVNHAMKILLVEDSGFVRRSEVKSLNKLGFPNVVEAEDGDDAIRKLEAERDFGLVISDWIMPNKDGYDLLVWMRASETYRDTPFIMVTARGEKTRTAVAEEAGVTGFITKPMETGELNKLIEAIFAAPEEKWAAEAVAGPRRTAAGKLRLRVAHIQITDHLALGVLKRQIETEKLTPSHFALETICMPSWTPVQNALEKGEVDAAFVLAPIAMDLFGFGAPIKMVLLAHKSGSTFVRRKEDGRVESLPDFFRGRTFYIPHELSIHHILAHKFLRGVGLRPGFEGMGDFDTFFEVIPPVQMPEFLAANPQASGFAVAEPIGAKAITEGVAERLFLSGELWERHPCCIVAVRDDLIQQTPDAVQEFVSGVVQAGQFIADFPEAAAEIGVSFLDPSGALGLKEAVLRKVLAEEQGVKTNDLFPIAEDFEAMQRYMVEEMGLGTLIDLDRFIDTRFAEVACGGPGQRSAPHGVAEIVTKLVGPQAGARISKAALHLEGKYLLFALGDGEYGLNVMNVAEIIEARPARSVPRAPAFVKGIIDFRGAVLPVIDLGAKLGVGTRTETPRARIVVLDVPRKGETLRVGLLVDSVSEICDVTAAQIEEPPAYIAGRETDYILGVAKLNKGIRILLDLERLFADVE